jgi:hypothetical protein
MMMKKLIILSTLISLTALAFSDGDLLKKRKYEDLSVLLFKKKLPVSSAVMSQKHVKKVKKVVSGSFSQFSERILRQSGPIAFNYLPLNEMKKFNNPSFNFLIGTKLYEDKQFKKAQKILSKVKLGHRYYAEKLLFEGGVQVENDQLDKALKTFFNCSVIAEDMFDDEESNKVKNYLLIVKDRCLINMARVQFEKFEFEKAIKTYNKINKKSFLWPYTLMEKAWAYYQLEKFNRTLGLVVTYKSPLLSSYFFPENELLTAMSYNKLCLWEDALVVIKNYQEKFKKQSDILKQALSNKKNSKQYFYELYSDANHPLLKHSFIKNIKTHLSKKIRLNLNLLLTEKITQEKKILLNGELSPELVKVLNKELAKLESIAKLNINKVVKAYLYDYINNIHNLSYQMFNINLDIVSDQRNLLYVNHKLVSDRARGSYENAHREEDEFFYSFDGPFWADELGDYAFGLKSNCQKVSNKEVAK